jgi:serine acetyltransferase
MITIPHDENLSSRRGSTTAVSKAEELSEKNMVTIDPSSTPFDQLRYLLYDLNLIVNHHWWRWITCWAGGSAGVVVSYRLDRFGFLIFKNLWPVIRLFFYPFFLFLRLLSCKHDIHYAADIGKGLLILHPSMGIVVSGNLIAGEHLTLTGGNCVGGLKTFIKGEFVLGNHVSLGVNAVVLGPVIIGNNVKVAAGAVLVDSAPDNAIVIGLSAKTLRTSRK